MLDTRGGPLVPVQVVGAVLCGVTLAQQWARCCAAPYVSLGGCMRIAVLHHSVMHSGIDSSHLTSLLDTTGTVFARWCYSVRVVHLRRFWTNVAFEILPLAS